MASFKPVPAPRKTLLKKPPPLPPKPKLTRSESETAIFTTEPADFYSGKVSTSSLKNDSDDLNNDLITLSPRTKNMQKVYVNLPPLPPRPKIIKNKASSEESEKFENHLEFEEEKHYSADVVEALNNFDKVLENLSCELENLNTPPLPPRPKNNAELQAESCSSNRASISTEINLNNHRLIIRNYNTTLERKCNETIDAGKNKIRKPVPAPRLIRSETQPNLSAVTEQLDTVTSTKLNKNKAVGFLIDNQSVFVEKKSSSQDLSGDLLPNNSSDDDEEKRLKTTTKSILKNKEPEQVIPKLSEDFDNDCLSGTSLVPPRIISIIKEFYEEERNYVNRLHEILQFSAALQRNGLPDAIYQKFFGLLNDIYKFHKDVLHWDFAIADCSPATIASCFVRHASSFHVYVERQLLIPKQSDLTEFEELIIKEKDLEPYINVTKRRVAEYIKKLLYLKQNCNREDQKSIGEALKVVENLYYQLEMVQKLRDIEDINQRFRECGQVHLDHSFKVSVNGNKRRIFLVYLCENMIIFANLQENKAYKYIDDVPTIKCYCCATKPNSNVFEIGIKGKKRFTLKAESQAVKERWCEELKKILQADQFEET